MIHTFEALFSGIIRKRVTFAHSRWVEELDIKVTKFLILMVNIPYPLFWAWLASLMKFVVITLYNGIYRAKVKNDPHFFSSEKEKNKPCRKCHSREKNRKLWRGLTSSIELNRVEPSWTECWPSFFQQGRKSNARSWVETQLKRRSVDANRTWSRAHDLRQRK